MLNKHVFSYFLHRYTMVVDTYYVNGSIDRSSQNFNAENRYTFKPEYVLFRGANVLPTKMTRTPYGASHLAGIDRREMSALETPNQPV